MARRSGRKSKRKDDDAPNDLAIVVSALASLTKPVRVPKSEQSDPDAVAERLVSARSQLDDTRFLHFMRKAQGQELADLARALCVREFLLLDANRLADYTIRTLIEDLDERRRKKPFRSWARAAMRESIEAARFESEIAQPVNFGTTLEQSQLIAEVADRVNRFDLPARRVIWLALVDRKPIASIMKETEQPYERVEWLLDSVLGGARIFLELDATNDNAIHEPGSKDDDEDDDDDDWLETSYGR